MAHVYDSQVAITKNSPIYNIIEKNFSLSHC